MSFQTTHRNSQNFLLDVVTGIVPGHKIISKFGSNDNITEAAFTVVSHGGLYQTPITAQQLEVVSSDIGDALNGAGMRAITIEGLDANFELQTTTVSTHATDGTIAVAVPGTWVRVFRAYVSASGTYATQTSGSHIGIITIRNSSAGVTWAIIGNEGFPHGQTQISAYTVAKNKTAYIDGISINVETSKPVNIFGFLRENANVVTAPYSAMRAFTELVGLESPINKSKKSWYGPFPECTDVGFLAKRLSTGIAGVTVDFEIMLIDNS